MNNGNNFEKNTRNLDNVISEVMGTGNSSNNVQTSNEEIGMSYQGPRPINEPSMPAQTQSSSASFEESQVKPLDSQNVETEINNTNPFLSNRNDSVLSNISSMNNNYDTFSKMNESVNSDTYQSDYNQPTYNNYSRPDISRASNNFQENENSNVVLNQNTPENYTNNNTISNQNMYGAYPNNNEFQNQNMNSNYSASNDNFNNQGQMNMNNNIYSANQNMYGAYPNNNEFSNPNMNSNYSASNDNFNNQDQMNMNNNYYSTNQNNNYTSGYNVPNYDNNSNFLNQGIVQNNNEQIDNNQDFKGIAEKKKFPLSLREIILILIAIAGVVTVVIMYGFQ